MSTAFERLDVLVELAARDDPPTAITDELLNRLKGAGVDTLELALSGQIGGELLVAENAEEAERGRAEWLEDGQLTPSEFLLLHYLGAAGVDRDGVSATYEGLAAVLHLSKKTIARGLKKLLALELVKYTLEQGQRSPFRITSGALLQREYGHAPYILPRPIASGAGRERVTSKSISERVQAGARCSECDVGGGRHAADCPRAVDRRPSALDEALRAAATGAGS